MPTPSENADQLFNHPDLADQTIDALGGDDQILIGHSNLAEITVTVNAGNGDDTIGVTNETHSTIHVDGGNGIDSLLIKPAPNSYIVQLSGGHVLVLGVREDGVTFDPADINYSGMERLVIAGTAAAPENDLVTWRTGDTIDEITVMGTRSLTPITISSGGGDDTIRLNDPIGNRSHVAAGAGNDHITGSSRDDILEGGDGDDILIGKGGPDSLAGNAGRDIFVYERAEDSLRGNMDLILEFEPGVDKIDLSALGPLQWIGGGPFDGTPGQLRNTTFTVQADLDGDKLADFAIFMPVIGAALTAADFIL